MVRMFVSFLNSYVEILTPKVIVVRSRGFRRWLGHEGGTLFYKRLQRDPLPFSPYKDTMRRYQLYPRKKDFTKRNSTHHSSPNRLSSPNSTPQHCSIISTALEKDTYKGKIVLENSFYFICFNIKIVYVLHL